MLRFIALALASLVVGLLCLPDSAFAGGCQQVVVAQPNVVQYRAVAALPLTTNYALDTQAYMYHVNSGLFQTWQQQMSQRYDAERLKQSAEQVESVQLNGATVNAIAKEVLSLMREEGIVQDEGPAPSPEGSLSATLETYTRAVVVMEQKCMRCHQQGKKTAGDLALFLPDGSMPEVLPYEKMMARVRSTDPAKRMPPDKPLSEDEINALADGLLLPE